MPDILARKGLEWFNYQNKNERPIKVVMRSLDVSVSTEDIKLALIEMSYKVIDVFNIQIKKEDSKPKGEKIKVKAPLHMLTFEKEEDF